MDKGGRVYTPRGGGSGGTSSEQGVGGAHIPRGGVNTYSVNRRGGFFSFQIERNMIELTFFHLFWNKTRVNPS